MDNYDACGLISQRELVHRTLPVLHWSEMQSETEQKICNIV